MDCLSRNLPLQIFFDVVAASNCFRSSQFYSYSIFSSSSFFARASPCSAVHSINFCCSTSRTALSLSSSVSFPTEITHGMVSVAQRARYSSCTQRQWAKLTRLTFKKQPSHRLGLLDKFALLIQWQGPPLCGGIVLMAGSVVSPIVIAISVVFVLYINNEPSWSWRGNKKKIPSTVIASKREQMSSNSGSPKQWIWFFTGESFKQRSPLVCSDTFGFAAIICASNTRHCASTRLCCSSLSSMYGSLASSVICCTAKEKKKI